MKNIGTRNNSRFFTLLEILICLFIVAMLSAVFGLKAKELIDRQKIESSIEAVRGSVEQARFLSLVYDSDIHVLVIQKKGSYYLQMQSNEPPLSKIKSILLDGIIEVSLKAKHRKKVSLATFSSGKIVSFNLCEFRGKVGVWKFDGNHLLFQESK